MEHVGVLIGALVGGYLLGAVPFGVVVSKCLGTVDPRTAGSRNVGFTNVLRVSGKAAGILTLIGDMGKGWVVGWLGVHLFDVEWAVLLTALAPVLGHLYPVFLKFRGGKGVATALGAVLGVAPPIGLSLLAVWLLVAAVWRYSSGGALAAFGLFPILSLFVRPTSTFVGFSLVVSALIWIKHKENIARLWSGTESRIGRAK